MKKDEVEVGGTYTNIRSDKATRIERRFEEWTNAIKNEEDHTCDHAVAGFEPLSVRFVWVAGMVAVVHGGLGFGGVAVDLDVLEGLEEAEVGGADGYVDY